MFCYYNVFMLLIVTRLDGSKWEAGVGCGSEKGTAGLAQSVERIHGRMRSPVQSRQLA